MASAHVKAAIDRELCAGGVAAFIRRQPGNDGGDFAGLAQALDRIGRYRFPAEQNPLTKAYFEQAGHFLPVEHPDEVAAAIRELAARS